MFREHSQCLKMHRLVNVLLLLSIFVLSVHCDKLLVRQTANGPIEGITQTSSLGQMYYAFKGVPFAEPPITGKDPYTGEQVDRRFKAPEPLKRKWTKHLKAHHFGDSCMNASSFDESNTTKSENCLSLNVYIPVGGGKKKTVLVFIHGGAFAEGDYTDETYGPDFLLNEDNILVTIQYRLGIFGFLNLGTNEYSGNMGLKDQQMALKWVYDNIENFSGNKDEILLFGESAGGACVIYQMLNEESRKYFNRGYAMSGSALNYFALTTGDHLERMKKCSDSKDMNKIIEYLKTTDSEELTQCHFRQNWGDVLPKSQWTPTIESPDTEGAFLTQLPEEIYNSSKAPAVDLLLGFDSQEHIALLPNLTKSTEALIEVNVSKSLVQLPFEGFNGKNHPTEFKEALEKLRDAYYSKATDIPSIRRANIDLLSELNMNYFILKNVMHQMKANSDENDKNHHKNTFLFRFGKSSELNLYKTLGGLRYDGATHGDELCYIFHCHGVDEYKLYDKHLKDEKSAVYKSIMQMVQIVTNFARTGNPSIKGDTPFKPSTSKQIFCQEINNTSNSSVTTNIMEQLHYKTWREIEDTYDSIKGHATFVQLHYGNIILMILSMYIGSNMYR